MCRVQLLEISQYLESYLWPHFDAATATPAHVMSILLMANEKFKEQVSAWACFQDRKVGGVPGGQGGCGVGVWEWKVRRRAMGTL